VDRWTVEQVLALPPDAASSRAARGLATRRPWRQSGADEQAVWGLCHGSGATPYQPAVDLTGPAYQCSCPSRKVPCKHALGLLLLWAQGHVDEGLPPDWVDEWLAKRRAPTAQRAEPQTKPPPDPEQQARRLAARTAKTTEGLEELDRWLRDLVRQGLASAHAQPYRYWDTVAARMVDAQAPGAGGKVRRMSGAVRGDTEWPSRLLDQAARLHLLIQAWQRRESLRADLQDELRTQLGWPWSADDVLSGPTQREVWYVVGQHVREDERLRTRRTWLWGYSSDRPAVVTETVPAIADFPPGLLVGTAIDAEVGFYPGAVPMRALVVTRHSEPQPVPSMPGHDSIEDALATYGEALGRNPWLDRWPLALTAVVPVQRGRGWHLRDMAGAVLRITGEDEQLWRLAALAGGHPSGVFGEWEDARLRPFSAFADGRLVAL
jgi:hypothetical protein